MPRLSIGGRWALRYTAATMVLLSLVATILYERIALHLLSGAEAELLRQTSAVTETLARNKERPELLTSFIETEIAGADPDLRLAVELLDEKGVPWLRRDILSPFAEPLAAPLPSTPGETLYYEVDRGDEYPYFEMIAPNGHGFTRASVYARPFVRRIEDVRSLFLVTLPPTLLLTGLLGWWLARQSLRPIARITGTARRITAAPSGEAIPVSGSGDELDRLAETLNEMLERIRGGVERMRRFSTDAAHQLRTPLSVLKTRLEVTLERDRSPEEYRRVLDETLAEIDVLGRGVYSVLQLADSRLGLKPEQRRAVALGPLLESVAEFFQPLADEAGVRLLCWAPREVIVSGDPASLHNLFANLLDNAIKYSKSGGSIDLELKGEPGFATVAVRDTGVGIRDQDRARIFDHFFRGHHSDGVEGIGLGLTLAAEIARAHGGSIELEASSRGCTFHVRLPREPAPGA